MSEGDQFMLAGFPVTVVATFKATSKYWGLVRLRYRWSTFMVPSEFAYLLLKEHE